MAVTGPAPALFRRASSPRLVAACTVAAGGFIASMVFGRAEYAASAAPFAVLVMVGVLAAPRPEIRVRIDTNGTRVVEGDTIDVAVTVAANPASFVDVAVPLRGPVEGAPVLAWTRRSRRPTIERRLVTNAWGRVVLGPVYVRAWGPLSLVSWEATVGEPSIVAVIPSTATLRSLVTTNEPRATAGAHPARARGDGWTFADVRPYQPGDRLRQINWRATARIGSPWINERHLDRSADLVLLVDSLAESADADPGTVIAMVRAAWAIAEAHLRANDRVGLLVFGGTIGWVAARSGSRAQAALFERLLAVEPGWTAAQRSVAHVPAAALPPGAEVIVLSPLHDERVVAAAAELRRRGFAVAALVMRPTLPLGDAAVDRTAARLWDLEIDRRTGLLQRAGIPAVSWPAGGGVDAAILALGRQPRRRAGLW